MQAISTSLTKKLTEPETAWIESESVHQLVSKVQATQPQAIFATIFVFALLYRHTDMKMWFIWLVFHVLVVLLRIWFVNGCFTRGKRDITDSQRAFYLRHIKIISLIGFAWGSTVFLYNDKEPSMAEAVCFSFVLIYGVTSVVYLSSHLQTLKLFVYGLSLGLISAIAVRVTLNPVTEITFGNSVLFLTSLLLAAVLMKFGKQLNSAHINSLLLQYRNNQLIRRLTQEKQIAIDAVASKNRMLASAAHDMRQPVLALDIYAGWLVDEPASSLEIAPKIVASTKAVIDLFDSMFDMSRLSEGQISTRLEAVNLYELISELFVQYQPLAKSKNLSLRTHTIKGTVFTDYILLSRILGNLISNAIKYTQTGGVLIACRNTINGISIEVWDTGVGISEDQQSLVFKEFYKSPSNLGTSDGFGLGLAIVTQLADLIGAGLTLRSRRGRGTVVTIKLGKMI